MPDSTAIHAYGATLQYNTTDSWPGTALAEVANMDLPDELTAAAKATHLESPNAVKEFKPGLSETDTFTLTLNFRSDTYAVMKGLRRVLRYYKITFPLASGETNAATLVLHAMITRLGGLMLDPEDETVIQATVELKPTGLATFTAGS